MRLKYSKLFTFLIICVNVFLLFYTWKLFIIGPPPSGRNHGTLSDATETTVTERPKPKDRIQAANKHIKKTITVVFRDFYHYDNDLKGSVDSILALVPNVQILIIYDEEPYPPLEYIANYTTRNNVKFFNLGFDVRKSAKSLLPVSQIKTKFVLLLPDSVRLGGRSIIQKMLKELCSSEINVNAGNGKTNNNKDGHEDKVKKLVDESKTIPKVQKKMLVVPFSSNIRGLTNCCQIKLDLANWTLEYNVKNGTNNCDLVSVNPFRTLLCVRTTKIQF